MKVAMFGTFDIGNFGDLFFPIVAEQKLAQLGPVELTRFSYRQKSRESWCYEVEAIQRFPEVADQFDLVIVGGGHLLHFNRHMALGYKPTAPEIPHPLGFWWLPAVAAAMSGIPATLHAVSADPRLPQWAEPLMRAFLDSLEYASVRDEKSHALLSRYAGRGQEIAIVPDSVFSVSDFLKRGNHSPQFQAFCREVGLGPDYMIIQPSHALRRHKPLIVQLAAQARERGWQVLELPIGYEIGNDVGFYGDDVPELRRIRGWPEPLLLAEIIANAQAVAGISLHLSVVASSYGIPVYRTPFADTSKFILLRSLPNIRFLGSGEALVGWSDAEPDMAVANGFKARLDEHWRKLAAAAKSGRRGRSRGWELLCATPETFRRNQPGSDRVTEIRGDLRRRRQLLTYQLSRR